MSRLSAGSTLMSHVNSATAFNRSTADQGIKWHRVSEKEKKLRVKKFSGLPVNTAPSYEFGEKPYQWELKEEAKKKRHQERRGGRNERKSEATAFTNDTSEYNSDDEDIRSTIRMVTGGKNVLSDEAIIKAQRDRQMKNRKFCEENQGNDSTSTYVTAQSSELSDSYRSAAESFELCEEKVEKSESFVENSLERYKKNALILGLLKNNYHKTVNNSKSVEDFLDSAGSNNDVECQDISKKITKKAVFDNQKCYDDQSLEKKYVYSGLYPSKIDEDVFVHPLKEKIKEDPEWRNKRLERQGKHEYMTPRQYYLSLKDSDFNFVGLNS